MMKKNYKMKRTISIKQFIAEFGDSLTKHMKQRLLELGERCILNRRDESNILDLRHIEHIKYDCSCTSEAETEACKKEYAYGQLIVKEGSLYFSQNCVANDDIMQSPVVCDVYSIIETPEVDLGEDLTGKLVDDANIDYVIDRILEVCPKVSAEHMAIIAKYCTVDSAAK